MNESNFFGKLFGIVLVAEAVLIWLALLIAPGALWFFTGNALWALLWLATLPLFLGVCAWMQNRIESERKQETKK